MTDTRLRAACYDCGLPYDDPGFADIVVPDDVWLKISPTGHEGGLLCPTCLIRAAEKAGYGVFSVPGFIASGPLKSMAEEEWRRAAGRPPLQ